MLTASRNPSHLLVLGFLSFWSFKEEVVGSILPRVVGASSSVSHATDLCSLGILAFSAPRGELCVNLREAKGRNTKLAWGREGSSLGAELHLTPVVEPGSLTPARGHRTGQVGIMLHSNALSFTPSLMSRGVPAWCQPQTLSWGPESGRKRQF